MRPQEIVERGLELLGPDRGTVVVEQSSVANLRWANSSLTTNGLSSTCQVHVAALPEGPGGRAAGAASAVVASADELAARRRARLFTFSAWSISGRALSSIQSSISPSCFSIFP